MTHEVTKSEREFVVYKKLFIFFRDFLRLCSVRSPTSPAKPFGPKRLRRLVESEGFKGKLTITQSSSPLALAL